MENILDHYTWLYPQLTLGTGSGIKESSAYADIVRRGIMPQDTHFPLSSSGGEKIYEIDTPAGRKQCLYLPDRNIFEYFVRVLAYRCDDRIIPRTTGSMYISGIVNRRKIENHRNEFMISHMPCDWADEFKRFTSDKADYTDSILLVTSGGYSGIECGRAGYPKDEWERISVDIRIYHELTHYVSRTMFPGHRDTVRDEVIADCIGLIAATGRYDTSLAGIFLGVENGAYRRGGRLENYVDENEIEGACVRAGELIEKLCRFTEGISSPFDALLKIEAEYVK